jgi:hypothetical protein
MRKGNAVGDEIHIATYNSKNRTVSDEHLSEIFSAPGDTAIAMRWLFYHR